MRFKPGDRVKILASKECDGINKDEIYIVDKNRGFEELVYVQGIAGGFLPERFVSVDSLIDIDVQSVLTYARYEGYSKALLDKVEKHLEEIYAKANIHRNTVTAM